MRERAQIVIPAGWRRVRRGYLRRGDRYLVPERGEMVWADADDDAGEYAQWYCIAIRRKREAGKEET